MVEFGLALYIMRFKHTISAIAIHELLGRTPIATTALYMLRPASMWSS